MRTSLIESGAVETNVRIMQMASAFLQMENITRKGAREKGTWSWRAASRPACLPPLRTCPPGRPSSLDPVDRVSGASARVKICVIDWKLEEGPGVH